jgi:glycosyltransferase involved in cell wall biosynthesis
VSLVVIGDGTQRGELEREGEGLPIRFRGAIYDEAELARYFKLADLLVLPGRVGLTCVHGFANGVPCITTRGGIVEQSPEYEYVEHGYNGLILPSDDPAVHAGAIRDLLEDLEALGQLGAGAEETARRLTMDRMVRGFEDAVIEAAKRWS